VQKNFYPKDRIGALLAKVVWEKGERVFRDDAALQSRSADQ